MLIKKPDRMHIICLIKKMSKMFNLNLNFMTEKSRIMIKEV